MPGRLSRFLVIGVLAAGVHWSVVVGLVEGWRWQPWLANPVGWIVAFGVSLVGHHRWTFADRTVPWGRAAWRHFVLSSSGFCINELAYVLALRQGYLSYQWALVGVLLMVAAVTYLLGKAWAFAAEPTQSDLTGRPDA